MAGLKANTQAVSQGTGAPKPVPTVARPATLAQAGPSAVVAPATSQTSPASSSTAPSQPRPPRPPQPPVPAVTTPSQPPSNPLQNPSQAPADDPHSPPVSPITPPLQPLKSTTPIPLPTIPPNFASLGNRAPLTYNAHPATVPTAPPAPLEPIDFENNSDVIALQATIGILLQQRKKAEEDIRKLRDAKIAAMERPLEFARDLAGGQVNQRDGSSGRATAAAEDSASDSTSDSDEEEGDVEMKLEDDSKAPKSPNGLKPSAMKAKSSRKGKATATGNSDAGASSSKTPAPPQPPPWANLPKTQDIVRCPPINWSQYAVQGEVLDKLHNEQLSRPTLGTPAKMGPNGTYEFTGTPNPDDGKKLESIFAPFDPLRDKIIDEKKPTPPKGGAPRRGA